MASLADYLNGLKDDLSEGMGKIPREAMVGVGMGLASGQPGAPLQGFVQGMAANQQGQLDAEERQMQLRESQAKIDKLQAEIEGQDLDNDGKRALQAGRDAIMEQIKMNPGLPPEEAVKLAIQSSGHEDWVDRWMKAENQKAQIDQKRSALDETRRYHDALIEQGDARTGVGVMNAQTGARNAESNAQRIAFEQQTKAAESQRERGLAVQQLDQQDTMANVALEEGERRIDELLSAPGFDALYGGKGASYAAAPEWAGNLFAAVKDPDRNNAEVMRQAIASDAVLNEFQQQKAAGVTFGAATVAEWSLLGQAAVDAARPGQTPQQAREKWQKYKEHRRKLVNLMRQDYQSRKGILGGQGAPAPSPGATPSRDQLKAGTRVGNFIYDGKGDPGDRGSWKPAQ
ncbi:hypothetical protein [Azotobacter chroococcum]|uniref:hypothetical protein n=1 Tax=Azotobacter chroococcum TaxID=353 RepID=UPI0010AE56D5|nr:hypothetical protein [Azotobacter chroococcum]TKD39934.1 hypothetical protein FCG41_11920 [Azotobacter chroococcum]